MILTSVILYVYYFSLFYPLPIISHISLDAKIRFIKEKIDVDKIDTIIVGSSIGLNNIQGEYLEKISTKCNKVLNLSVYEASTLQVEKVLEFTEIFPNLKRIIYSAQFFDIRDSDRFKEYNKTVVEKYMTNKLGIVESFKLQINAAKNIPFLIKRQIDWELGHKYNNKFNYLGFDKTGSVSLHIYGKDIIKSRWEIPTSVPKQTNRAYKILGNLMKKYHKKGIHFYFVQQPYRLPLIAKYPYIRKALDVFVEKSKKLCKQNDAYFLSLYKTLPLEDKYFADRAHLNDKGNILTAKKVAKFIDSNEKNNIR